MVPELLMVGSRDRAGGNAGVIADGGQQGSRE